MNRTISSKWTFSSKFVASTILIILFGLGTWAMFYNSKVPEIWIFLLVLIFGIALTFWACMRLKKVDLDDVALHISNYRISVEVPLRSVEAISEGVPISPELVRISFRRPTEFGNKVVFIPKLRFFIGVSPHPIVNELRQLVSEARVQH